MTQIKIESLDRDYLNIKSMTKGSRSLASTLDLLTINGSESGPLKLTKYQYNELLKDVNSALANLEFTKNHLQKYLDQ